MTGRTLPAGSSASMHDLIKRQDPYAVQMRSRRHLAIEQMQAPQPATPRVGARSRAMLLLLLLRFLIPDSRHQSIARERAPTWSLDQHMIEDRGSSRRALPVLRRRDNRPDTARRLFCINARSDQETGSHAVQMRSRRHLAIEQTQAPQPATPRVGARSRAMLLLLLLLLLLPLALASCDSRFPIPGIRASPASGLLHGRLIRS